MARITETMTHSYTLKCSIPHKRDPHFLDPCLIPFLMMLRKCGVKTLSSCCGHGKYPATVVIRDSRGFHVELFSGQRIPRNQRFYQRDKEGIYFIPELKCFASKPILKKTALNRVTAREIL
ncbi:MAG: hypothetical protein MUP55_00675 [Candidatus Aenigmarchaeota archaeon]|nr:hypothetical protein [Candidatus Aenigmarchaeota archaeon]